MTARRGPLRTIAAVRADGSEVLSCGHTYPSVHFNVSARPNRRRCPECPSAPRTDYFRTYDTQRKGE